MSVCLFVHPRPLHSDFNAQAHVARLAQRLAQWPSEAVRCAKASVLAAERMPHTEDGVIGPGAAEEGVIGSGERIGPGG